MKSSEEAPQFQKNDPKIINAWALFDWANSSYALVIAVAIFPTYFNQIIDDDFIFLGMKMSDTALFSYSISFSYLIIVLLLPMLSGIADYGGKRLSFMKFFTTMGSLACISMFFFTGMSTLNIGLIGFIVAVIGFAGGQVFYNSYLPIIATDDQVDRVSAKGFSMGYIGSVILLVINLVLILKPATFGLADAGVATRISFVMVGLWWIGFAQIPFRRLPKDEKNVKVNGLLTKGFQELTKVWHSLKQQKNTRTFLMSFFFYSAGVQTVIYMASTFASDELKFDSTELIVVILILQLIGIAGANLFANLTQIETNYKSFRNTLLIWAGLGLLSFILPKFTALPPTATYLILAVFLLHVISIIIGIAVLKLFGWKGNKVALIIMLCIWISICFAAYFIAEKNQFYIIAATVGLVMGGIQALSRSTYSKLIPDNKDTTASYFSFFDVTEKLAIVIGTFSFGFINQLTGGMRNSILTLSAYFLVGIILLLFVDIVRDKNVTISAKNPRD